MQPPHRPPPPSLSGAPSTDPRYTGAWWGLAAFALTMGVYFFGGLCLATAMGGETDAYGAGRAVGMMCCCVSVPSLAGPILVWRKQALIGWIVTVCMTVLALAAAYFAVAVSGWEAEENRERDEWIEGRNAEREALGLPAAYRREGGTVLVDGKALGRDCSMVVAEANESLDWILLWEGVVCTNADGSQSSVLF